MMILVYFDTYLFANTTTKPQSDAEVIIIAFAVFALFLYIYYTSPLSQIQPQSNQSKKQQIIIAKGIPMTKIWGQIDISKGYIFEEFLCEMYYNLNYLVEMTPRSNDNGTDLILYSYDGRLKIVVQAKRSSKAVGKRAVQEVLAARIYYEATHAIVITNNMNFTRGARNFAERTGVELIDRRGLALLIRSAYNL